MRYVFRHIVFCLMFSGALAQSNLPVPRLVKTSSGCNAYTYQKLENITIEFDGNCVDGSINGKGTLKVYSNNKLLFTTEGEFKDGLPNGQATSVTVNGGKFVGELKDGAPNGIGTYSYANGNKYIGEWVGGKYHGQGTLFHLAETQFKGDKYVGEFKNGKYEGQGTYFFLANNQFKGEKYIGEFKDGKYNGQGTLYASDGRVKSQGLWADHKLVRSEPVIQVIATNSEIEKYRTEAEEAKKKQSEIEAAQRLHNQQSVERELEIERLRIDVDVTKIRQRELESQLANGSKKTINYGKVIDAHALIIGNASYKGSSKLSNPINDAKAMSAVLRGLGFSVTESLDLDRANLVATLAKFSKTASKADITLLFYAGHGVQISGTNYMLPVDLNLNDLSQVPLQGVSLNSVVEQYLPGKTKLVFLDACRDNPLMQTASRGVRRGLAPINVSEGTLISYSTKDGQLADDGDGKNSPFTAALLKHLGDPDDIAVVLRKVREDVLKNTNGKQQPWEYGSLTGGALMLSAIKPIK